MANIYINGVPLRLITSLFFCCVLLFFSVGGLCQSVPALYIIGDSLVDVGNNNYLVFSLIKANFPHNGVDFPMGEATGRFSNGKNPADFLAEKVGLPTAQPYLSLGEFPITGVNLASAGAGIFNRIDLVKQVIPVTQQVDYYSLVHEQLLQQLGSEVARTSHLAKSLFMIVIGSNDLFHYFHNNSDVSKQYTPQQYVELMASTVKQIIKRLYDMEARKFMMIGVGMIGCGPAQRRETTADECKVEANDWSKKYNDGIKLILQDLKSELSEINYSYFDTYDAMNDIIQDPQSHGITEIKDACCGIGNMKADIPCIPIAFYCSNRKNHLFWDRVHPTEIVSSLFVELLYNGPQEFTFPINVEQLAKL